MFANRTLARPRAAAHRKLAGRDTSDIGFKLVEETPRKSTIGGEQTSSFFATDAIEPDQGLHVAPVHAWAEVNRAQRISGNSPTRTQLPIGSTLFAVTSFLMGGCQTAMVRRATAAAADAAAGAEAPASLRLLLRRGLRAAVAMASIVAFLIKLQTMLDSMAHLDIDHIDLVTDAQAVLDLATSGPGLMESCRDLMQLRVAVSLVLERRNAAMGGGAAPWRPTAEIH